MTDKTGDMPAFAGVVLAGGRSSRMGRDKAELIYQGRSLLAHALARLQDCGAHPIVISGPARDGYATVPDQLPGLGPLGGIHAALAKLMDGLVVARLLIVPVDMPALRIATLTALIRFSASVMACHYAGHPLPLGMALNHSILAGLGNILNETGLPDSRRSLQAFCAGLETQILPVPCASRAEFQSLNTPAEWTAFSTEHAGVQAP